MSLAPSGEENAEGACELFGGVYEVKEVEATPFWLTSVLELVCVGDGDDRTLSGKCRRGDDG